MTINTMTQIWDKTAKATQDQMNFKSESKTKRRSKMKIERK